MRARYRGKAHAFQARSSEAQVSSQFTREERQKVRGSDVWKEPDAAFWRGKHRSATAKKRVAAYHIVEDAHVTMIYVSVFAPFCGNPEGPMH